MKKREDRNTRYYLDLNLLTREIVAWDYDQRDNLRDAQVLDPPLHRVFLTKGQYNKLDDRHRDLGLPAQK